LFRIRSCAWYVPRCQGPVRSGKALVTWAGLDEDEVAVGGVCLVSMGLERRAGAIRKVN
jgi:hypothetical protein